MTQAGRVTLALGVLLTLWAGAPAQAQVCSTICGRYESGQCVEYDQTCVTPEAAPRASYGAIAYGRDSGAWGTSYHWDSRKKAESVALKKCAKQDCEVMVWFDRKCGALASGQGPDGFWGLADTIGDARGDAKSKCVSGGGKGCEILAAQCSK